MSKILVFTGGKQICTFAHGKPYGLATHGADLRSENTTGRLMTIHMLDDPKVL